MNLKTRIQRASLSPSEQELAQYILEHGEEVMEMKIQEFADMMELSRSTVIRFAKALKLQGWKQLKIELASWLRQSRTPDLPVDANLPFNETDSSRMIASKLTSLYQKTIREIYEDMDFEQLDIAVQLLEKSQFIYVITAYHNLSLANNFADKLLSIGFRIQVATSFQTQGFICQNSSRNDTIIFISYSSAYRPLETLLKKAEEKGVRTILITGSPDSRFDEMLHARLNLCGKESRTARLAQFSSDLEVHFMLDILYGALVNKTREGRRNADSERDLLLNAEFFCSSGTY